MVVQTDGRTGCAGQDGQNANRGTLMGITKEIKTSSTHNITSYTRHFYCVHNTHEQNIKLLK